MQVGDAGTGYPIGTRRFAVGGPRELATNGAGDAFLATAFASVDGASIEQPRNEAWGSVFRSGQGWTIPVRLLGETPLSSDFSIGVGLTADGARFGWSQRGASGLRAFDVRGGWLQPQMLVAPASGRQAWGFVTDSDGLSSVFYVEGGQLFLVRESGSPELMLETVAPNAFATDGGGSIAAASYTGALAVRLPEGRLVRTAVPAAPGAYVTHVALAGRPAGGFVVAWIEWDTGLTYAVAEMDASGSVGERTLLGSAPTVPVEPTFGVLYDAQPRVVARANGAAIGWRAGSDLYLARERRGAWDPAEALPGAAVVGGRPTRGATLPFALALDGQGVLLVAWTMADALVSAQRGPGQAWSRVTFVAPSASDPLLAMNESGTAFAAWREGSRVMAARSARR